MDSKTLYMQRESKEVCAPLQMFAGWLWGVDILLEALSSIVLITFA